MIFHVKKDLSENGKKDGAVAFIRDVHWSYKVQGKFIKKYYIQASTIASVSE